jgi:hypothetical protein
MNTELILMFGSIIILAVIGLLVFCFTESRGKNTPYARGESAKNRAGVKQAANSANHHNVIPH